MLMTWLKSHPLGERNIALCRIADACGVTPVAVRHWSNGTRQVPVDQAPAIERATGGGLTCEQLCPDVDWIRDASGQVTHYRVRVQSAESKEVA